MDQSGTWLTHTTLIQGQEDGSSVELKSEGMRALIELGSQGGSIEIGFFQEDSSLTYLVHGLPLYVFYYRKAFEAVIYIPFYDATVCIPCDQVLGVSKSGELSFFRSSGYEISPLDTTLGPLLTPKGEQMPSSLAEKIFCGKSFLPQEIIDFQRDHIQSVKPQAPFATIRSSPPT